MLDRFLAQAMWATRAGSSSCCRSCGAHPMRLGESSGSFWGSDRAEASYMAYQRRVKLMVCVIGDA